MQRPGQQQLWLCLGLGLAHIGFPAEKDQLLLVPSVHLTSARRNRMSLKEALQGRYNFTAWLWPGQPKREAENSGVSHSGHFLEILALAWTHEGINSGRIQTSLRGPTLLWVL